MNCQNCKHWICLLPGNTNSAGVQLAKCRISGLDSPANCLCNAWELSLSYEQVSKMPLHEPSGVQK